MARRTSTARVREPAPIIDLAEARLRRAARASTFPATHSASAAHAAVATCAITAPVLRLPVTHPSAPKTTAGTKPRGGVRQHFTELRTALTDGWEIVQPIFARPLWTVPDNSATAFNFVLRREADTRLVTVPEGRTVVRFIRDRRLVVDYRR
jgi:hypothetical protein